MLPAAPSRLLPPPFLSAGNRYTDPKAIEFNVERPVSFQGGFAMSAESVSKCMCSVVYPTPPMYSGLSGGSMSSHCHSSGWQYSTTSCLFSMACQAVGLEYGHHLKYNPSLLSHPHWYMPARWYMLNVWSFALPLVLPRSAPLVTSPPRPSPTSGPPAWSRSPLTSQMVSG
jgi:hypothetical protein